MARILGYILLILAGLLWFLGCSPSTMRQLSAWGWMADDYRYGDLYRFSHLAAFRSTQESCKTTSPPAIKPGTHLVLLGDSFTEPGRIEATDFVFEKFTRLHVAEGGTIRLDSGQRHILVLETVERHFQERFIQPYQALQLQQANIPPTKITSPSWLDWRLPYDEDRHQAFLFSTEFFLRIKEIKAWILYHWFGRVDDHVFLSADGHHLFYAVDREEGLTNGFAPISEEQIKQYVQSLNQTRQYYRALGFEEVYVSIIPNKSSILGQDTGTYNHLVERIQAHPALQMPFLDMFGPLEKLQARGYGKGDTHWTCAGQLLWVNQINQLP